MNAWPYILGVFAAAVIIVCVWMAERCLQSRSVAAAFLALLAVSFGASIGLVWGSPLHVAFAVGCAATFLYASLGIALNWRGFRSAQDEREFEDWILSHNIPAFLQLLAQIVGYIPSPGEMEGIAASINSTDFRTRWAYYTWVGKRGTIVLSLARDGDQHVLVELRLVPPTSSQLIQATTCIRVCQTFDLRPHGD